MTAVRFLGPDTDAYVASVERHAGEFEERTGLELDIRIIPSDEYFSNKIHHLLEGESAADVYMSGPVLLWEHVAASAGTRYGTSLAPRSSTSWQVWGRPGMRTNWYR